MSQLPAENPNVLFGSYFSPEYFSTYFVVSLNTLMEKLRDKICPLKQFIEDIVRSWEV